MIKQKEVLNKLTTEELINVWEGIDSMAGDCHTVNVRGWVLDEMIERDVEAFDKWTDDEIELGTRLSPKSYFIRREAV